MPTAQLSRPVDESAIVVQGRTYGNAGASDHFAFVRTMPVPAEMEVLVHALHSQSKLLALSAGSPAALINEAYGADLALLMRYRDAFKKTLGAAVHARADAVHGDAHDFLSKLTASIGEINHDPKLDLGPNVMRLEPADRLLRLQQEFRDDVDELKAALTIWLHALTENDTISAIEWLDPEKTAVRYHFFRMESMRESANETHDPGLRLDGRYVTTKTTTKIDVTSERRTHTVVNAKSHTLSAYPNRVPERIARLIDTIPAEVRPFVTIIDGQVTKEEVSRSKAGTRTDVTERAVWVKDPTPALFGTWALAGWGGSTPEVARSVYAGHALSSANAWLVGSLGATGLATGLAMLAGGRVALIVGLTGLLLTGLHQLGRRIAPEARTT